MLGHLSQFVFVYGSLISQHSRGLTVPEQANRVATPVVVQNVERIWSKRSDRGMTAMGVRFVDGAECVGVLLHVSDEELLQFDKREKGYTRESLPLSDVDLVPFLGEEHYEDEDHELFLRFKQGEAEDADVRIWVYVQKEPQPPSPEHPIVQTYVDTILRGCLSISEEFAREFIRTTKGWHPAELSDLSDESTTASDDLDSLDELDSDDDDDSVVGDDDAISAVWINDRHKPVYLRGDPSWSQTKGDLVDSLLMRYRPDHFASRKSLIV